MSIQDDFIKAYDRYSDALFRYCYFRVYEREKAKDLVQETFLKTWQYIAEGKPVDNLRAFLYKVAYHLIVDYSRKIKENSLDTMREKGYDPFFDEREKRRVEFDVSVAFSKIQMLDEIYREPILMRYVDGFSVKEIARHVGETENAISVRIHRGIKQLRKLLPYE